MEERGMTVERRPNSGGECATNQADHCNKSEEEGKQANNSRASYERDHLVEPTSGAELVHSDIICKVKTMASSQAQAGADQPQPKTQKHTQTQSQAPQGHHTATTLPGGRCSERAPATLADEHEEHTQDGGQRTQAESFRIRTAARRHLDLEERPAQWAAPFFFIQAADCQFGMIDSYVHKRTEPGWQEEIELCQRLVALCNGMAPRPAFLVICGDLVDSLPASDVGRAQVADFKRIFANLSPEIPLVCVCGNHDVGDEPTQRTISDYRRTFGDDYFHFTKGDVLFIVINSQFYQHREHVKDFALEQDRWLEALLDRCKLFRFSFIFEHIPWFLEHPEEEDDYFNIKREVRLTWLEKFSKAGVTKIMCGHYHRNAGGWFKGMEVVVTSAVGAQCGEDKSGIRIVKVNEKSITHQYYAMDCIPLNIEL